MLLKESFGGGFFWVIFLWKCFILLCIWFSLLFWLDNLCNNFLIANYHFGSLPLYLFTKEAKGENKERKSILLGLLAKEYAAMPVSEQATMAIKSYQSQAGLLLKEYVLADPFIPYTSIIGGILACKMVHSHHPFKMVASHMFHTMSILSFLCFLFFLYIFICCLFLHIFPLLSIPLFSGLWCYPGDQC